MSSGRKAFVAAGALNAEPTHRNSSACTAVAALAGDLSLPNVTPSRIRGIVEERVDPVLFRLSYDYVGDLAETIALIWPAAAEGHTAPLPGVAAFVHEIEHLPKAELASYVAGLLDRAGPSERWAMIKLATGGLRVGVSARLAKTALAACSGQELGEIEKLWHGLDIPYANLFAWLDGTGEKPEIRHGQTLKYLETKKLC